LAGDVTQSAPEGAKPGAPAPAYAPQRKRYAVRFVAVYGALVVVLAAGLTGLVVLVTQPAKKPAPIWSSWKPVGNDPALVANQIAQYVSGEYRFKDGKALVGIQAAEPSVFAAAAGVTIPVQAVVLRGQAAVKGSIVVHPANHALQYQLCGGGNSCSIGRGKPTVARGVVVRREAVELALYTFKYVSGIDSVIALLPPVAQKPQLAVYVRRGDLAVQLRRPLRTSLPPTPPIPASGGTLQPFPVDDVALSKVFKTQPQQLQDGAAALVLDPA
jgi:hypothetical protein